MLLSQRWALATDAVLVRQNEDAFYLLGGRPKEPRAAQVMANSLNRWWGITDRPSLLSTLHSLMELDGSVADVGGAKKKVIWDASRLVGVAGWGYLAGTLEEREAWTFI